MVDPELQLSHVQRSHLQVLVTSEGWRILQNMMEAEVERFKVALINVKAGDTAALVENHAMTKAAAMFTVGLINRINDELALYRSESSSQKVLDDPTEQNLDLGDYTIEEGV
jgi:hypothetical protein